MNGILSIEGLRLKGKHGVLPQEQLVGNEFLVDLKIVFPVNYAAKSDDVSQTINYAEVVALIKDINARPSALIENFAYRIKEAVIAKYPQIESGQVTVHKPFPPIRNLKVDSVSITLTW